ncbi:Argininosuccinate lyase [Variovorax sp. SRS16]|uniref:Bug family tripartite tricarboxylate transporter substrate binding protein n=1 Tax=Variovorax sp. SRS16 TaxID=282217 RepID=UPI0013160859|nr:tripartite tricarboxylate transporter substrate binding protein [Variovorax sp. SRS16]VTU30629.1 Argininosuccinate lyase [Variovorax sp. SRS16]
MTFNKRAALRLLAATAAWAALAAFGQGDYPSKPVQVVVAYPAGGGTDILARIVTRELDKAFGQSFIVINKPGASGVIGTAMVARAAPDGYTLLIDTGNVTLRPAIEPATPFKPKDFTPVALLTETPVALAVNASVPVTSVAELVAYSHANPGKINYASTGPGSPQNLVTELMKIKAGVDWQEIPYQGGGPALNDLNAGRVQLMFSNPVTLMPYANTHRLKVLAVTSRERLPALESVPTMAESGQPELDIGFWNGVVAPAGTPAPIVARLSDALLKIMKLPEVRAALLRQGSVLMPLGPEPFAHYMAEDTARWERVAKTIRYKPLQ